MKLTGEPLLDVRVMSPTKTIFEGKVYAVSAVNKAGPFDILADHANFFSLLSEGNVSIMTTTNPNDALQFPVQKGLIKVTNNKVTFFIDIEPAYLDKE